MSALESSSGRVAAAPWTCPFCPLLCDSFSVDAEADGLALRGSTDTLLLEREELTAGSTWHAAGGFHAINADARVAALQQYTISMYPTVEAESGQPVGLKMSGGLELAGTEERWRWLRQELAWLRAQARSQNGARPSRWRLSR